MAERNKVLLGFVDEPITENYKEVVDFTTNKLGGVANWIDKHKNRKVTCKKCGSITPLLLQIYAPIAERIRYHRTLYIFACLNPSCWGNSKSWTCVKDQVLIEEKLPDPSKTSFLNEDWCTGANNWETNQYEFSSSNFLADEASSLMNRVSVREEENANVILDDTYMDVKSVLPSAEIEPDENEPITLDSPTIPHCDLVNLLKQVPTSPRRHRDDTYFIPFFIYVLEEKLEKDSLSEHVQILLMEYSKTSGNKNALSSANNVNASGLSDEKYEKSTPLHGDKLFHAFLSRIKSNPDQIIRYCRNNRAPLFLYPETDIQQKCTYCKGDMVFELQILPTLLNYLRLTDNDGRENDCLEFGSAFIYTCKDSCDRSDGEESVIIQMEKF